MTPPIYLPNFIRAAIQAEQMSCIKELTDINGEMVKTATDPKVDPTKLKDLIGGLRERQQGVLQRLDRYQQLLVASAKSEESETESSPIDRLLQSDDLKDKLKLGLYALCPIAMPLGQAGKAVAQNLPFGDFFGRAQGFFRQHLEESAAAKQKFLEKLEGATVNPTTPEEFQNGNLFTIDEDALNELVGNLLAKSGNKKVKNIKIRIDGDELKIKGEYDTIIGFVDFTARLQFELKNGEVSGKLDKVKAIGIDLSSIFETDILNSFRRFDIAVPEGAKLEDLSWVRIPGIERIEIAYGRVVLERTAPKDGPS